MILLHDTKSFTTQKMVPVTQETSGYNGVPSTVKEKELAINGECIMSGNSSGIGLCHGQYNGTDVELRLASGCCKSHYRVISFRRR